MTTRRLWILLALAISACGAPTPPPAPAPTPAPAPAPPADGSATPPSTGDDGAVCGTRGAKECPADQFCSYAVGANCGATDHPGHCATKPKLCPHLVNPVCGCDGKTYNNGCEAARASTGLEANGACAPG